LLSDESTVVNAPDSRGFPAPWSVEEQSTCFTVQDANGQKLGYFYFEEEPGRRSAAKLLTKDEARRIAAASDTALARHAKTSPITFVM
jgi:hypothetical protein